MNILCLVKQVLDSGIEPQIIDNKVDRKNAALELNPYDSFGITEALKLEGSVTAISVGSDLAYDALKYSLSLGCDSAILLRTADDELSAMLVSRLIYNFIKDKGFDIIFTGKKAIDDNAGLVGAILASLLGIPFVYGIRSFSLLSGGRVSCGREVDFAYEEIELSLPCIFACEKGLNEPLVPSLQSIMRARRKQVEEISLLELEEGGFSHRKALEFNDVKRESKLVEDSALVQVGELMSFFIDKGFIGA